MPLRKLPQFPAFYFEGNERHAALLTAAFAKTEFHYCGFRMRVEHPESKGFITASPGGLSLVLALLPAGL